MSNIPNFVSQVQNVEHQLKSEWITVQEVWRDSVAVSFGAGAMEPYMRNFPLYIEGDGYEGLGIDILLRQMDKHLQDMDSVLKD